MHAFFNGRYLPAHEVRLSVWDAGFVTGSTVSEQLRTFGGKLFQLEAHLARLARSLEIVGIDCGYTLTQLADIAQQVVVQSLAAVPAGGDLGLAMVITPGPYAAFAGGDAAGPTVCLHAYPLAFDRWAAKYRTGESLALVDVEMVSPKSWPRELKCRSRMHYVLAEQEVARRDPGAKALLRSTEGYLCETAIANLLVVRASGQSVELLSPPRASILPGISLDYVAALCPELGWTFTERELTPADLASADEAWLTSTPWCVLPVTRFQRVAVGSGAPGPLYQRLLALWGEKVGVDIAAQAQARA